MTTFVKDVTESVGRNLTYIGTVATLRDLLSLSDALVGPGKVVNYWGVKVRLDPERLLFAAFMIDMRRNSYGTVIGNYLINSKLHSRTHFEPPRLMPFLVFPDRAGRVILDGIVNPLLGTSTAPYKSPACKCTPPPSYDFLPTGHIFHPLVKIQDVGKVFVEFTTSCAAAGPQYCALAEANATSASITAKIRSLIDDGFNTNSSLSSSAYNRGEVRSLSHWL